MKLLSRKVALPFAIAAALVASTASAPASTVDARSTAAVAAQFSYQGDAYGTKVNVGNTVRSGPSAPVTLGCTTTPGIHKSNTVASVNASPVLTSGTVTTTAGTFASPIKSRTSATVENVNLLSGVVTATAVRSVSSTSYENGAFQTSAAGTTFTSLRVAGELISATVAPNTRINIAGFGYVILNEQIRRVGPRSASLTVNAIHLVITEANLLNIAVGTNVIVAHARSGLVGPVAGTLDGFAYGSSAKIGNVVTSGPSFRVVMPCEGTNGKLKTNTGLGVSLPGVLVTGTIRNTALGTVTATSATGETTSTVERANVLDGLVQATVIKADAHAFTDGTNFRFSDAGSSFASLSVQGFPAINENVDANTKLNIAGLGTLWLHRVIRKPNSIEVRMIELVVTQDNPNGLPIGSNIKVAVAHASAH